MKEVPHLPGPGARVRREIVRTDPELVARALGYAPADLADATNRMFGMDAGMRRLCGTGRVAGAALTIKVYPGDNRMVHEALPLAEAGDVLVVDTSGSPNAVLGGQIAGKARARGVVACVIDGFVRDLAEIAATGLAIVARGACPNGPHHRGPGEINHPIACGGVVVRPGDLIAIDDSGVVVVERESVELVLERLEAARDAKGEPIGRSDGGP